ncbi:MAG: hypothetical protein K6E20_02130 [Acholeplasmatales bacterium]|nr:hypothetical protein [Acholeplasmatales bacterium]
MNNFEIKNMFSDMLKYILLKYEEEKKINKDTTIIYPGIDKDVLEIDDLLNSLKYKYIIVASNDIDLNIKDKIKTPDLVLIPPFGYENIVDMANDMKLEIDNSIVINLFEEKYGITYYYKEYAQKIYKKYNEINSLIIPLDYPFLTGVAKYYRMKCDDIRIIGIKNKYESSIIDLDLFDEIVVDIDISQYDSNCLYIKY